MTKEAMKDQPLFGPVDQVVNTLEAEASWVKGEIKRCEKSICRMKGEIDMLAKRQEMITESLKFMRETEKKRQEAEGGPITKPPAAAKPAKKGKKS